MYTPVPVLFEGEDLVSDKVFDGTFVGSEVSVVWLGSISPWLYSIREKIWYYISIQLIKRV